MKLKDFLNIEENDSQIVTPDTVSYIKRAICDFPTAQLIDDDYIDGRKHAKKVCDFLSIYNYNYPTGIDFDKYYDTYQKQNIFDMTVV